MKTLIVSYLPRGERSYTKKLLDTFLDKVKEVEYLDLTKDVPDFFMPENLTLYMRRAYGGEKLSKEEQKPLEKMDRMTKQFIGADIVVLAFPMHNFSMPAPVKAYFDSIMQKGKTWDIDEKGFVGLMKGKKALVLITSGGIYDGEMANFEHAMILTKSELQFMGFEVEGVTAAGTNMPNINIDDIIKKAQEKVKEVVKKWYK